MSRADLLAVSEIFGPTIQGEGPSAGSLAMFIRLARCNFDCSWCDTPYTWDWKGKNGVAYDPKEEVAHWSVPDIITRLRELAPDKPWRLVITGGEPLLQSRLLTGLLADAVPMFKLGGAVDIETNGTQPPLGLVTTEGLYDATDMVTEMIRYNISPKLSSSGVSLVPTIDEWATRLRAFAFERDTNCAVLKFVISDSRDALEAAAMATAADFPPDLVWFMPEGATRERLEQTAPLVIKEALKYGVNYSDRLHVRLWSDERGR